MSDSKSSFWTSLPGILTGVAAVITAIAGLMAVWPDSAPAPQAAVAVVEQNNSAVVEPQAVVKTDQRAANKSVQGNAVVVPRLAAAVQPQSERGALARIDCNHRRFQPVADKSIKELQKTAAFYYTKVTQSTPDTNARKNFCQRAIEYQGSAWCQAKNNKKINARLVKTIELCASDYKF